MTSPKVTLHRPHVAAIAALWVVGIGLAGYAAPLAWRRSGVTSAVPFIAVIVLGALLARGVLRRSRWALCLSVVLLAAQIAGVVGSAWQLIHGVDETKGRELHRLGVNPRFGVALNLVFSSAAVVVFAWAAARWFRHRPVGRR